VVWLGLLPAWQSVLGHALNIDPLSQCLWVHPPAGWGPRGRGCMWDHVGTNFLPPTRVRFFLPHKSSYLSLLPSVSFRGYLTWTKDRRWIGKEETRSALWPVTAMLCVFVFLWMWPQACNYSEVTIFCQLACRNVTSRLQLLWSYNFFVN
jgi:hypothetical protein